jgi:hypothetical protein
VLTAAAAGSWQTVVGLWALVQGAHVALRYVALSKLRFRCGAAVNGVVVLSHVRTALS